MDKKEEIKEIEEFLFNKETEILEEKCKIFIQNFLNELKEELSKNPEKSWDLSSIYHTLLKTPLLSDKTSFSMLHTSIFFGYNGIGKSFFINILLLCTCVDSFTYRQTNESLLRSTPSYQLEGLCEFYLSSFAFYL